MPHEYTLSDVRAIHDLPIPELILRAQQVHREHHRPNEVQLCSLLSVKTGGCPEDCAYCPQSCHYDTGVERERMMTAARGARRRRRARRRPAPRASAWAAPGARSRTAQAFDEVLEMVRGVRALGMEACVTLGMLTDEQAQRLAEAGLTAYNHNLDTSREFYGRIITTRTYDDRLDTLARVRKAGITVCCGGIIGMGESIDDRCAHAGDAGEPRSAAGERAHQRAGAGRGHAARRSPPVDPLELVRMIATARILMPDVAVRLSAGRTALSREAQVLCFLAGANSIFYGEKLLATGNPDVEADQALLRDAGLRPAPPMH